MSSSHENRVLNFTYITVGVLLIFLTGALWYISPEFSLDVPLTERPVLLLVTILIIAGGVYLASLFKLRELSKTKRYFIWLLAVGVVMRLFMIASQPMLEDDYFRYLWDGAVTANAINPYSYSPESVLLQSAVPEKLIELEDESDGIVENINNPSVRTIYPPFAQAMFALSYIISPFNLTVWKIVLLVFDLATLLLLFYALRAQNLPYSYLLIYWWNPLFVKEIFNSGHLDVLVLPFIVGGLLLASQQRLVKSAVSLVIGIGAKLWPAFILPLVLRPLIKKPKKLVGALILITLILGALFVPIHLSGLDRSSGFVAYGESWQNNDSIFRGLILVSELSLDALGYKVHNKYYMARVLFVALLTLWIIFVTFSRRFKEDELYKKSLFVIAFVFLTGPTQFPWYYTWLIPLLTISPRFSLLLPTLLLPLYYLRYYFEPLGKIDIFTNFVVWIEFVPVWVFILWEWRKGPILRTNSEIPQSA